MDLKQLRHFLVVADLKSLSKAAVVLSLGQSVLSRQMRALEQELGIELFHRNGRGLALSEAGRILELHARISIQEVERALGEITSMRSSPTGKVAVAVPPSVGWVVTQPLVRECRETLPNVALHIVEGFSGHVMEWLSAGRVDIGVIYNAPRFMPFLSEPLLDDELVLLGPASNPEGVEGDSVTAARLAEIPLILPAGPHGLRVLIDTTLADVGLAPRVEFELDAMASTLGLVEEGIGYTVLSESTVRGRLQAGLLRSWRIHSPAMKRSLVLATSPQRPMTAATRAVAKLVRASVRALAAPPKG